jgi:hypothetical protein
MNVLSRCARAALAVVAVGFFSETVAHAATTLTLSDTPLWTAKTGDAAYPFLANDSLARGVTFNPHTGNLIVASRTGGAGTGGLGVHVLNGQTGAVLGTFNVSGITGGTFSGSMVGVADDGAIYVSNLTTGSSTSPLKVYKWASESAALTTSGNTAPTTVYNGDPTGGVAGARFGDSFDVRGSGSTTKIILGNRNAVGAGSSVALLTPSDATAATFGAQHITNDVASAHISVAFGSDTEYWTRVNSNGNLRKVSITGGNSVNTVGGFATTQVPLGVDVANSLLGIVDYSVVDPKRPTVSLYDISDPAAPTLVTTRSAVAVTTGTGNANSNGVGSVDFGSFNGNHVLYAMGTNNGIVAYSVVVAPEPASLALVLAPAAMLLGRRRRR